MGYTIYSNVATKSYVDEKVAEVQKKTIEHSDTNRQTMLIDTNETLNKLRTHDAVLDAELSSLRETVRVNSQWIEDKRSSRR